MKVEVRPLDLKKWHGKKNKESFTQPKTVEVLVDSETGRLKTGLTEEEAELYSKKLGVDLSDRFDPNEPHSFYSTKPAWIPLINATMYLETEKPMDFVKVKILKASKDVANSMKEWEEGLWPDATHVIYDEAEEVQMKAGKVQTKQKAYAAIAPISADGKADIIRIMAGKNVKGRGNDLIDVELDALIESDPTEVLRVLSLGGDNVRLRAQILALLDKNILTKEGSAVYYMGQQIAMDYEDTVKWFKDPNNSQMKVVIMEKLQ